MARDRGSATTNARPTARGTTRTPVARILTAAAVQVLPAGAARERYRREFTAEQCTMTPLTQTRHALGILLTIGALRTALAGPERVLASETLVTAAAFEGMNKPWRCRLGWHSWVRRHGTPDPNAQVCRRCGKHSDLGGGIPGAVLGPGG